MPCEVEYTDEFEDWWNTLDESEQAIVDAYVKMLEEFGVALGFPYSSDIKGSKNSQMRELRAQHRGRPYRVLYAFDPRRMAILLVGGDKTGNNRWYEEFVPIADALYEEHLETLEKEKSKMAKSFKDLRAKMSPASIALSDKISQDLRQEIMLTELRHVLDISQEELGELLNKKQAAISRLERRSDMHVSTLRAFVKALGGKLEIIARFPDASYHIKQFEQDETTTADEPVLA